MKIFIIFSLLTSKDTKILNSKIMYGFTGGNYWNSVLFMNRIKEKCYEWYSRESAFRILKVRGTKFFILFSIPYSLKSGKSGSDLQILKTIKVTMTLEIIIWWHSESKNHHGAWIVISSFVSRALVRTRRPGDRSCPWRLYDDALT